MEEEDRRMTDASPPLPELGLVCMTSTDEVRFRTVTRTNYLKLDEAARLGKLRDLYHHNLGRLLHALDFCAASGIRLYRMTSQLFPMSDLEDGIGAAVLGELADDLPEVGRRSAENGVRVVVHPDQFVVLSSDSPAVVENARLILGQHARNLDLMHLPRSAWTTLLIHGGKGGRGAELVGRARDLPDNVRSRLALENDEHIYSAAEILVICHETGLPFVFDAHHHLIKEKLDGYEDPSFAYFVAAARETWPDPAWQIVHLSNGREGLLDRRHSELIAHLPSAFLDAPWIEVEAKGKERAIADLQEKLRVAQP